MKLSEFEFETNKDFYDYIEYSSTSKLLKLYQYTIDSFNKGELGAMIDGLEIYRKLRERGLSKREIK